MRKRVIKFSAALGMSLALASVAAAQLPRTFVSSTGSDANDCSRNSPCRSLSAAIPKTQAGGEITALDSAAYGPVTIAKPLTIQAAPGAHAILGGARATPVVVSAGASDRVVLRNLYISRIGTETATRGISFNSGGVLHIENCVVSGFNDASTSFDAGIYASLSGTATDGPGPRLFIKDTITRDNGTGIYLRGVVASIDHSRMENNGIAGVWADHGSVLTIRDSLMAGNASYGLQAYSGNVTVHMENCVVTNNSTGLYAAGPTPGPNARIYVSHTMIAGNEIGLSWPGFLGAIYSFGNNRVGNNGTDGTFTSTIEEQ